MPDLLRVWRICDERPSLYLRFLAEIAMRPRLAARMEVTRESIAALLGVASRMEGAGAPTLAAVLLANRWLGDRLDDVEQPTLLCAAVEFGRRLHQAVVPVSDNNAVLEALAFAYFRPLLSCAAEVQDENPGRGTRFKHVFLRDGVAVLIPSFPAAKAQEFAEGRGAIGRGAGPAAWRQEARSQSPLPAARWSASSSQRSAKVTAAGLIYALRLLGAAALPAASKSLRQAIHVGGWRGPAPDLGLLRGVPWAEAMCKPLAVRQLLMAWLMDFLEPPGEEVNERGSGKTAIGSGLLEVLLAAGGSERPPSAVAVLLFDFVESELTLAGTAGPTTGTLRCLRRLLAHEAFQAEASSHVGLAAQLMTCCEGDDKGAWLPAERADACAALALLLDSAHGDQWALRLLPLQAPARALQWAARRTVGAAAAYGYLRRLVRRGGIPVAREIWRLCPLVFEHPGALRDVLLSVGVDAVGPSASGGEASRAACEEWRLLCLAVLAKATERLDPYLWGSHAAPSELAAAAEEAAAARDLPKDAVADAVKAATALRSVARAASIVEERVASAVTALRPPTITDTAAAAAAGAAAVVKSMLRHDAAGSGDVFSVGGVRCGSGGITLSMSDVSAGIGDANFSVVEEEKLWQHRSRQRGPLPESRRFFAAYPSRRREDHSAIAGADASW